jgi:nitrite reductase/ring-hydroxylating ferredoxin subunit
MLQQALQTVTRWIEQAGGLDGAADAVSKVLDPPTRGVVVKKALSGTWLSHRLHPAAVTVPLGAWVGASTLDLLDDERAGYGADAMVALGLAAALPSAASGAADWVDTYGPAKRVGLVHLTLNTTAVGLYGASLAARMAGRRQAGRALALGGLGVVTASAWLGGHLSYMQGVGIDRRAFQHLPGDWTVAMPDAELPDDTPKVAEVGGAEVLLYRSGGRLYALSNKCGHEGGPLAEGTFERGCVVCPWHGSTFRLADGIVERAPAAAPQPVLDARVSAGMIEVRSRD